MGFQYWDDLLELELAPITSTVLYEVGDFDDYLALDEMTIHSLKQLWSFGLVRIAFHRNVDNNESHRSYELSEFGKQAIIANRDGWRWDDWLDEREQHFRQMTTSNTLELLLSIQQQKKIIVSCEKPMGADSEWQFATPSSEIVDKLNGFYQHGLLNVVVRFVRDDKAGRDYRHQTFSLNQHSLKILAGK